MEATPPAETELRPEPQPAAFLGFRAPRVEEVSDPGALVGRRVEIFWDGDNRHYSGRVVGFDESSRLHGVKYDDGDEDPYEEDLSGTSGWRIFDGDEEAFQALRESQVTRTASPRPLLRASAPGWIGEMLCMRYDKVTLRMPLLCA